MSKQSLFVIKNESKKTLHHCFLLSGSVFLLITLLGFAGGFDGMEKNLYDLLLSSRIIFSPLPMSPRIVPVDLNDRAERNLGERVDTREAFVQVFKLLGDGGVCGGLDFLFAGTKKPLVDRAMAESVRGMENLVLAIVPLDAERSNFSGNPLDDKDTAVLHRHLWHPILRHSGEIPSAVTFLMPNRALAENASVLGHIGVESDHDGVYRKTLLFYRWEDGYIPSFSLALASVYLGIDPNTVIIDAGKEVVLPLKDGRIIHIPVDKFGALWIPYPSNWKSGWKRIPMDTIANAIQDENSEYEMINALSGALLVIADTTTTKKDFGVTPFESLYPLSGIHASVINGILTNTFFYPLPRFLKVLILLFLFILSLYALIQKREEFFHLLFCGYGILLSLLIIVLWFYFSILPFFVIPFTALFVTWGTAFAIRLFRAHEQKMLFENALLRYFPRALAVRVLAEKKTDLTPVDKELSILFADIAGFTRWSADKSPESVHEFLSDYLESMATIIYDHGGTVDKFIGDGILAFFGDPFEQPDHAERAFRAALAMQEKVIELRKKWQPIEGIDLKIRIGINAGNVIVGNLGTRARIEYTVIGAAVNLASRMESNAPIGGILVTSTARDLAGDKFEVSVPCEILAKGYEKPVQAFVLKREILT